eukprot:1159820-Pelagomonas_calceolata.AAC.10
MCALQAQETAEKIRAGPANLRLSYFQHQQPNSLPVCHPAGFDQHARGQGFAQVRKEGRLFPPPLPDGKHTFTMFSTSLSVSLLFLDAAVDGLLPHAPLEAGTKEHTHNADSRQMALRFMEDS